MGMKNHLTYKDRVLIEKMIQDGVPCTGISIVIGKHRNSISREICRCGFTIKTYNALEAQIRLT